jgi:hypothetical protein
MTHDSTKFQKIETKVVTYAKNHKVLVSHAGITLLGIVCGIPAIPLITIMGLSELTNVIVNK